MKKQQIEIIPVEIRYPKRLLALADLIEKVPKRLFTMDTFRRSGFEGLKGCGTVGCVLGHAPQLLKKWHMKVPREYDIYARFTSNIDFNAVSRVFGVDPLSYLWDYLFSDGWKGVDNTPTGAAKRIRWVVHHKGIPKTHEAERTGTIKPSYCNWRP